MKNTHGDHRIKINVNVALLDMQGSPKGLNLNDYPRNTEAIQVKPDGPSSWWGAYLLVNGRRYRYDPVTASRVGGHGGPNAAGSKCGHIGTTSKNPKDWRNCEGRCTVCGQMQRWGVPYEFFFTRA
jgi:FAD/FMN-containing dehydrogenase